LDRLYDIGKSYGEWKYSGELPATLEYIGTDNKPNPEWDLPITYEMNAQGFRCAELKQNSNSIICLGPSTAAGIGLPEDKTWPHLLGKELNLTHYNLAEPGGGFDHFYRIASVWVPYVKPKYVFLTEPPIQRRELFTKKHHLNVGAWSLDYEHLIETDEELNLNRKRNLDAIENVCRLNGAKFFFIKEVWIDDKARDKFHTGISGHDRYFSHFRRRINNTTEQEIKARLLNESVNATPKELVRI
jgi:hypothetical protein